MKVFYFSILFLFLNTVLHGNRGLDSLLDLGKEYSYQFEFQKAQEIYEEIIQKYPNTPFAPHSLSQNYLWFFLGSKDSLYKNLYKKYSEEAITKAEVLYDVDEDNPKLNNLIGNIYLLKSMLHATEGNSVDAFWAIKSSVSYFEDAVDFDENYYDPYLGLGTIKYALSFVPGFLGWAISITGLSGDKEEGLRLIKLAYDRGKSSKTEAAYHLAKIYTEYNAEYDSAKIYLDYLIKNYPQNILFLYQYSLLMIDLKELEKAEETLMEIIENDNKKFSQTNSFAIFLRAEIAFKQNNFNKAILLYDEFLMATRSIDYTGLAHLKIGLCYEMLQNNLLAKKYFILARNGNLDIPEDLKAKNESYLFYNKKFNKNDKSIILAENYFDSKKYRKAIETISEIDIYDLDFDSIINLRIIEAKSYLLFGEIMNAKETVNYIQDDQNLSSSSYYAEYFLLLAQIKYTDKNYILSQNYLNSAFENCDKSDNKLMRQLVNLKSKLRNKKS